MHIYQNTGRYKDRLLANKQVFYQKRAALLKAALFVLNQGGSSD